MEIAYRTKKLAKTVKDLPAISKNYGKWAKKVHLRLEELKAAPTLQDMAEIPQARCHELTKDRKGQLAVRISVNHRIIFIPDHEPLPAKEDGGLDWELVTHIKIMAIGEDYH